MSQLQQTGPYSLSSFQQSDRPQPLFLSTDSNKCYLSKAMRRIIQVSLLEFVIQTLMTEQSDVFKYLPLLCNHIENTCLILLIEDRARQNGMIMHLFKFSVIQHFRIVLVPFKRIKMCLII